MGTAFSIDTPLRVSRYGISSVVSLVDDTLIEQMREYHCRQSGKDFHPIANNDEDGRAKRITAYLDLLDTLVRNQVRDLRASPFEKGSEITRYFEMLPESPLKNLYNDMLALPDGEEKKRIQERLRRSTKPGSIDVNIMTKVDRDVYRNGEKLPTRYNDALAALRGYAHSRLESSIVFSAGLNPRLYSYTTQFDDFFPGDTGVPVKKIVLKVSDYRSSVIQGKFLAKKGLWVSEYRIESGLNCGGHAFATKGHLIGPILEEFKKNRRVLTDMLGGVYRKALTTKGRPVPANLPPVRITVQGGIGSADEDEFLMKYYSLDGTGWGTPFLLVPEVTTVDEEHRRKLAVAGEDEVYLSDNSPFGLPFWNLRSSASEESRRQRIEKGKPGSACPKGHLRFNTEFTKIPLCLASRAYQKLKLEHLQQEDLEPAQALIRKSILDKSCICHDLAGGATLTHGIDPEATPAICPGPNMVNFSRISSLEEMIGHIYGRLSILTNPDRPHMFISELKLYVGYLRKEVESYSLKLSSQTPKYLSEFQENLGEGIEYYRSLTEQFVSEQKERFLQDLRDLKAELENIDFSAAGPAFK